MLLVNCHKCNKELYKSEKEFYQSNSGTFACGVGNALCLKVPTYSAKTCIICNELFGIATKFLADPHVKYKYCSRKCRAVGGDTTPQSAEHTEKIRIAMNGEGNSNFGNYWSDEQKKEQSVKVKAGMAEMGEEARIEKCGSSNRGKKRSKEFIDRWHSTQKDPNYIRIPYSDETRKLIGIGSSNKFTTEYKAEFRKKMIQNGKWAPAENSWHWYRVESDWKSAMWFSVHRPAEFCDVGIFNSKTNVKGYVRDHKFSRFSGYKEGLYPELLRHPANCQIITMPENSSKRSKNSISLEQLLDDILHYPYEWKEQNLCIGLITRFKNGNRWTTSQSF